MSRCLAISGRVCVGVASLASCWWWDHLRYFCFPWSCRVYGCECKSFAQFLCLAILEDEQENRRKVEEGERRGDEKETRRDEQTDRQAIR